MKIAALSDMHGHTGTIESMKSDLSAADVVLLVGDITTFGSKKDALRVIDSVRRFAKNILAVPGNCDTEEVISCLSQKAINLHGRSVFFGGMNFVGLGGSLPCPGRTPNEFQEHELEQFLKKAAAGIEKKKSVILVSHQPPFQTSVDVVFSGRHVGSRAVRAFIEDFKPALCFTGHIHEAAGQDVIGRTSVLNPGPLKRGGYAFAEIKEEAVMAEIRGRKHRYLDNRIAGWMERARRSIM